MANANAKVAKVHGTRQIGPNWVISGTHPTYTPNANTTRNMAASWAGLQQALKAGKGKCTVAQYLAAQAKANPANVGDGLPCLRHWAGAGKLAIAPPA